MNSEGTLLVALDSSSRSGRLSARTRACHVVNFDKLNAQVIRDLKPETVISSVMSARFDCMDVAALLAEAGFDGRYGVIAEDIPDPGIIRDELRRQYPLLAIDLIDDSSEQFDIAI
jgi:hypothetical protein